MAPMTRTNKKLKTVPEWVANVGVKRAVMTLINHGLAITTADKIANGRYQVSHYRRASIRAIQQAMAEDGFIYHSGKAS